MAGKEAPNNGETATFFTDGVIDTDQVRATFARIARLARRMAKAADAHVVLSGARGLLTLDSEGAPLDHGSRMIGLAEQAMAQAEPLWIENLALPAWRDAHPPGASDDDYRFYAAAPIVAPDGQRVGVLAIADFDPRARDADVVERLADHAACIADEWGRGRAVSALARSKQRLSLATTLANVTVWEMDYRNRELISDGAQFFGPASSFESLSSDIWGGVHPDDRERAKAMWRDHLATGAPYRLVHQMLQADGPHCWVESAIEAIRDKNGAVVRTIGAIRDIDHEKRAEIALAKARDDAEAANRAKSQFLATMSHEIRTPLNGVLGMAQAMAMDELAPLQRERLKVIHASGEALLAILNDILDLAKIEAGKLELEEIEFDLEEVARGAHQAFTAQANAKGLSFALDIGAARGVYRGDPVRLRQILYNLVSNALKFTDRGEIRVTAQWVDEALAIKVADTGVGIPEERLEQLFGRFAQADASTTRRFGGTGLGLAICRELAEMMGGSIKVDSAVGVGSVFSVALPLARLGGAREPVALPSPPTPDEEAAQAINLRVLAAEDNTVNQLVLKTLLHQVGVDPTIVANGAEAVAAWEAQAWDLILMDVQMPQMDGPTATRVIRDRESADGRQRTPIIALTANVMSHQLAEYLAAGMDGHVAKPIEARRLFEALEAVFCEPAAEQAA